MIGVRLIPVVLSLWLLAAHFLRDQSLVYVFFILAPALLLVRRPWVARLMQVLLVLGAAEWVLTLYGIAQTRLAMGEPWVRMAVILFAVALCTGLSALVFRTQVVRHYFTPGE